MAAPLAGSRPAGLAASHAARRGDFASSAEAAAAGGVELIRPEAAVPAALARLRAGIVAAGREHPPPP
jgi:hypothetical protein